MRRWLIRGFSVVDGLECRLRADGDSPAGEALDFGEESGIEMKAELGELAEFGWVRGIVGREHAGGGPGGFADRNSALEDNDAESVAGEFEREGEADDPGTGDDYIRCFHSSIVRGV
jgi:hypothetical protein